VDEDFERECGSCFLVERGGQPFQVTAGGDPVRLEVKMPPIGKISGRVLDYVGKPVPNASLQLHWGESWLCKMPSCIGISRQTKTNEKGEYSVTDLDAPGTWLLSATAPLSWKPPESRDDQRLDWAQTFYPGVTDHQLAERVMARVGGEISNLDIKLAAVPVHRIRGVVLDVYTGEFDHLPPPALWRDPRVMITPHISGASDQNRHGGIDIFCENLRAFLDGAPLRNVIDWERGY